MTKWAIIGGALAIYVSATSADPQVVGIGWMTFLACLVAVAVDLAIGRTEG